MNMRAVATGALVLALGTVGYWVWVDRIYWDRYLNARSFDSFIENPFPSPERLYPQETVGGVANPRQLPRASAEQRSISSGAIAEAVEFAAASQSTSLLISHNGVIQAEHYWLTADADTLVYSFSMHKSVVAMLIGILLAEGEIESIDTPLSRYLPEWRDDPRERITVEHALQMASGLEPMDFRPNPFSRHVRRQIGTDLARVALSYPKVAPAGETFDYNGVNPTLLVMLMERATGSRYAEILSHRLWQPVGNADAKVWLDRDRGLARGATSLFATPMDWLRLGEMLRLAGQVGNQQVVPQDWIERMITPSPANPMYGYLTWIADDYAQTRTLDPFQDFATTSDGELLARDMFYFDGLGGQRVYVIRSLGLVIVRTGLLNSEWNDTRIPNILIQDILTRPTSQQQLSPDTIFD